ncbi:helix-turn-helix transcriptional regulator [Pantanalinema rosaneae CENA516]|uniref:helix-turn-helix transcriptional regulator n=1 Tax=Pantanalinema rosaneae TaxID=1620701 RepID=UPI003D6FBBA4
MAIVLSDTTWTNLWQESRLQARQIDPKDDTDCLFECPSLFGRGYKRDIFLRNGIQLTFHRYQFQDDLVFSGIRPEETECLEWVFNLSSTFRYLNDTYITNGQHYVAGLFLPGGVSEELARDARVEVDIHLEPEQFCRLIDHHLDILPTELLRMLEGDVTIPLSPVRTITPTMQLALQQMLDCPYQGVMKQMYLESKSIEVLTLWLDQALANDVSIRALSDRRADQSSPALRTTDVDRIHQAKEILLQQFENPPSLMALARQVGLNDCTLKRGFKQVFGTTVFGYLHQYRMEQARSLLLNKQCSVTEVARRVGYNNACAFSTAFRKKFGVSPRSVRQQLL